YCHSDGKGRQNAPFTAGSGWNSSVVFGDCKGCHGNDSQAGYFTSTVGEPNYQNAGPGTARANTHTGSHVGSGLSSCANCHVDSVTAAGAINGSGLHINGGINVKIGNVATGSYNPLTKGCTNISCHASSGTEIQWGSHATCATCHGDLTTKPGVHSTHISDMITSGLVTMYNYTAIKSSNGKYRIGCANCHPTDVGHHRDGHIDVTINKNKLGGSSLAGLNSATADFINTANSGISGTTKVSVTCSMVYCHSSGKSTVQAENNFKTTPDWYSAAGSTANRCGMCHDNPPQYDGQSHYDSSSMMGMNNTPPYKPSAHLGGIHFKNVSRGPGQNGFLGFSSIGNVAHGNINNSSTITCNICHSGIVDPDRPDTYAMFGSGSPYECAQCHKATTKTKLQAGNIVGNGLHINGKKDVIFPQTAYPFKTKSQLSNNANAGGNWMRNGGYKADENSYDSTDLSTSTWNPADKSCNTACHVNQSGIIWGSKLKCMSCHANQ
ncbi:CxxxxCH/CxxCH domain-containing protein, partial [Geobacter pelophilus]